MDFIEPSPQTISPTATATANNTATANSQQPSPNTAHPTYPEMIVEAIKTLDDRTGSSRHAIEKYVANRYPGLPPTFAEKLGSHLHRMKGLGQLVTVKHSYKLPSRSASMSSFLIDDVSKAAGDAVTSTKKQGPEQIVVPFAETQEDPAGRGSGSARKGGVAMPKSKTKRGPIPEEGQSNGAGGGSRKLFVSLGLEDGSDVLSDVGQSNRPGRAGGERRLDEVVQDGLRKRRGVGRPAAKSSNAENQVGLTGPRKRGGGRPRKIGSVASVVNVAPGAARVVPDPVEAPVPVPFMQLQSQPQPPLSAGAGVDGEPPAAKKRRGRQPKAAEGVEKNDISQPSDKSMGRPEQSAAADDGLEILTPYEALMRKFNYLRDSVKETVSVVKPSVNNATAMRKLNKLDELASVLTL